MRQITTALLILSSLTAFCREKKISHDNHFKFFGKVIEYDPVMQSGESPAAEVPIVVYQEKEIFVAFLTSKSGLYEFYLPVGHVYEIWYGGSGFVNKIVALDASECPGGKAGKDIKLDMGLFRPIESLDFPMLLHPFVRVSFDKEFGTLVPDIEEAETKMRELDKVFRKARKAGVIVHKS